jgi:predicted MFS family arabinose efflux permease
MNANSGMRNRAFRWGGKMAPDRLAASNLHRVCQISVLIGCGVVASAQIGKAIISIPMIRAEMGLGLDMSGLVVATIATLGALAGICAGVFVKRLGAHRALVGGLFAISIGNIGGATAAHAYVLLGARIVEGVGFFGVVLAIPSMLSAIVTKKDRDFVMALWSAYMPAGITLMLLAGSLIPLVGWRNLWLGSAVVAFVSGILAANFAPGSVGAKGPDVSRFFNDVAVVIRDRTCILLAFTFFAFSCQIFSMVFALPFMLTSAEGIGLGTAGLIGALVMAVSTVGHIASGFFLRAGAPIWMNIAVAFVGFAALTIVFYSCGLPPLGLSLVAALALGIGGLAPGALYAAAPSAAPNSESIPPTIGLLQQASNLGQFAGPVVLGAWAQHLGWSFAPFIVTPAALCGLVGALALRGAMTVDSHLAKQSSYACHEDAKLVTRS